MKYARCPNCGGRLGIPNKKRGRPIACPKCDTEFVAPDHLDQSTTSEKNDPAASYSDPPVRKKPSVRAIPLPGKITSPVNDVVASKPGIDLAPPNKTASIDLTPPSKTQKVPDDLSPPPRSASASDSQASDSPLEPPTSKLSAPEPPAPPSSNRSPLPETPNDESNTDPTPSVEPPSPPQPTDNKRQVATIIKTETIRPSLTKDGKLPTLQLNDHLEPKPKEEPKSNPVLLVAVLGASLVSSAIMLLMFNSESDQRGERIEKTRQKIRVFYEVRPDQEIKPYQNALRHAQLAHSREDYRTEIRAYETVMARFRDENFDQYSGLTGSQSSDRELEKWVSILLEEAKRNAKR